MILRFILFTLGIYILYKLVFDLIIPIFRTTQTIRKQFGEMQQNMQDHVNAAQRNYPGNTPPQPSAKPAEQQKSRTGDYIDFEEVK